MAQIDSSIALGFRPTTQLESPVNNLAKMMQIQSLQQGNQLNQLKMDEYRSGVERKNKLAELYGIGGSEEETENRLRLAGFADEAQGIRKNRLEAASTQASTAKTEAETREKGLKQLKDQFAFIGQLMADVKDQASYDQALQIARQNGIPLEGVNPVYDPAAIEQNRLRAMSVLERLDQANKDRDFGQKERQQGEVERHNQRTEGISQGQLGVSQANLGLRRQELELSRSAPKGQFIQTDQGYVLADPRTGQVQPVVGPDGKPVQGKTTQGAGKPLPATALKMQNEALDMIGIASSINADLGAIQRQIKDGKLEFGPVKNIAANARNAAGMSNEQSRNFATFKSTLEKLRNDSLRLNKGVQTDGDAQRAWNELFQNINDPGVVSQRLDEIGRINARAVELRKREVEDIRNNYNQPQYDFSAQTGVSPALGGGGASGNASNIDALLEKYK